MPLPVQPEAEEQLTWWFQTRAEEAGTTGLSQHIREVGAKQLAQLISRTGLSQRKTRWGVGGRGNGGPQTKMGGPSQRDGCATHPSPLPATASLDIVLVAKAPELLSGSHALPPPLVSKHSPCTGLPRQT